MHEGVGVGSAGGRLEARGSVKMSRSVLGLLGVVLCAGLVGACSNAPAPNAVPRVGVMHVGTDQNPPSLGTLVAGLGDLGWFDGPAAPVMQQLVGHEGRINGREQQLQGEYAGQRITLIWRNREKNQAAAQAEEFVRERVDVIVAFEDTSIAAAQAATADPAAAIPVVFLHPSDPVRDGLIASVAHPAGNLTGAFGARDPVAKQLEHYRAILPGRQPLRLLTLVDRTDSVATPPLETEAKLAAGKLGIELVERYASDDGCIEAAFQSVGPCTVDGVFTLSPSLRLNNSPKILGLAAAAKLPVQAHRKEWVDPQQHDKGALFSLGVDLAPVGTAAARFVDSILKGSKPADLPAQEVPKIEFALSLKRAAELGIDVPPDVIEQADRVYPKAP